MTFTTGSAKQIAWAEDIINSGITTIRNNMEKAPVASDRAIWAHMEKEYNALLAKVPADAKFVIDHRKTFDGEAMIRLAEVIRTMVSNGKALEDIHF